jgi:hypothetical protein
MSHERRVAQAGESERRAEGVDGNGEGREVGDLEDEFERREDE